jgi:thymidylate kinase
VSAFGDAINAMAGAGVGYRFRKFLHPSIAGFDDEELDLWVHRRQRRVADGALRSAGFHPLRAPGQGSHRFYVAWEDGRWRKVDLKLERKDRRGGGRSGTARVVARITVAPWRAVARRLPAGFPRRGPIVAVLGPDGAGKGTVISALVARIPIAVDVRYLGRKAAQGGDESSHRAPNVPGSSANGNGAGNGHHPSRSQRPNPIRECAFVAVKAMSAWSRLLFVYVRAWRGRIILCDRHPIEVMATRPRRSAPAEAIERFVARRLMPRPDAIVVLDAPAEVLFKRKREHSVAMLERWRNAYAEAFVERGAAPISTVGPREGTIDAASQVVWEALRDRRRW